jgi:hypothetical protein
MEPTARDPHLDRCGRCKALLFAVIAMQVIHLVLFGFDPKDFIHRHPWLLAVDWFFAAVFVILLLAIIAYSLRIMSRSAGASASAQSTMGIWASLFMVSLLGPQVAGASVVSIVCSITQIGLCVLAIWYMAKAMGEATQKDINAKLGCKVSAASGSGDLVQKL